MRPPRLTTPRAQLALPAPPAPPPPPPSPPEEGGGGGGGGEGPASNGRTTFWAAATDRAHPQHIVVKELVEVHGLGPAQLVWSAAARVLLTLIDEQEKEGLSCSEIFGVLRLVHADVHSALHNTPKSPHWRN